MHILSLPCPLAFLTIALLHDVSKSYVHDHMHMLSAELHMNGTVYAILKLSNGLI